MLKNYFTIGLRNLLKNKLFSIINISGMAISISVFLIIALYLFDEFRFDKHVQDVDLKYRVFNERHNDNGITTNDAMISPMITQTMATEFPEVEFYTRIMNFNSPLLFEVGNKKLTEAKGGYADPTVFEMFDLTMVEGDRQSALKEPNQVVISKSLAEKYFGNKPALGENIEVANDPYVIGGVFEDFSKQSHLHMNYFLAMDGLTQQIPERMQSWIWSQFHSYIKLKPGANAAALEGKLKDFAERNAWPKTKPNGSYYIPHLMSMRDIHLYASDHRWDIAVRGNAQTVYILSATAIFIIVIAILNFINLSTARAINRVKEVGVRKVVGAVRKQLIYQFISEAMIVAFLALLIGVLITDASLPALNAFMEKEMPTGIFLNPLFVLTIVLAAGLIGIAAGFYPAFYISGYKPAQILGNKPSGKTGKNFLRKGLVVLQFVLSFMLITAAIVVSSQHTFMRNKDMGFEKENVVALQLHGQMTNNLEATKQAFLNHPNILSASLMYGLPGEAFAGDGILDKTTNKDMGTSMLLVDEDYVKTLGLKLIAGRDFSKEFTSDRDRAFIISEAAARMLGYSDPKDAVNHEIGWKRWDADSLKEGRVVGVVQDIHLNSLKEQLTPVVMHIGPQFYSSIAFRIKSEAVPETIAHLESTWKKFNTEWPFEYRFIDDNFDKLYKSEEKLATLFAFFTGFTIFVACLGLFGLVVYSTTQRYREISIRKVLGADEASLVVKLSMNYMLLIGIAFIIAGPLSFYASEQWLMRFPYHIDLTPMLFVKSGLVILVIALLTVGIQSLKAARTNPVNALKEQ